MILPIYTYGAPILRQKCKEVEKHSLTREFMLRMLTTMHNANGLGLAAPQIGKELRLFVADFRYANLEQKRWEVKCVFINPIILKKEGELVYDDEGCLSIPALRSPVSRYQTILLQYLDQFWEEQQITLNGSAARIVQHECDHLDGILFIDHLKKKQREKIEPQLEQIRKGILKTNYPVKIMKKKKRNYET